MGARGDWGANARGNTAQAEERRAVEVNSKFCPGDLEDSKPNRITMAIGNSWNAVTNSCRNYLKSFAARKGKSKSSQKSDR